MALMEKYGEGHILIRIFSDRVPTVGRVRLGQFTANFADTFSEQIAAHSSINDRSGDLRGLPFGGAAGFH